MKSNEIMTITGQYGILEGELLACHECDLLHKVEDIPGGGKALCSRCGAVLYKNIPNSLDKALVYNLTAIMLFIMANSFPFISLKLAGRIEENLFLSGAMALYRQGMGELGLLVFLTSFLFPLMTISGMLYILLPIKLGSRPPGIGHVYRLIKGIMPWSLTSVFMLGVLISIVKLLDLATIIPGISLYSFAALMFLSAAAHANMDPMVIWPKERYRFSIQDKGLMAEGNGLINCHTCSLLVMKNDVHNHEDLKCPRCSSPLHTRKSNSVTRTWALILTAALLYIPANVYPVMTVIRFGSGESNTILGGVVYLIEAGMWGLAMIILFASIVVPILKLLVLSFLLITVMKKTDWRTSDRTRLFRITEGVGAWSMVDIYVVAVLAGLVNLGALSTIKPGIGASFFGAVVITTMLAAHSFDPRLIWDNRKGQNE